MSAQEINHYLQILVEKSRDVFWVRSSDYSKQFYVSPSYETIWGRPCSGLYENPEIWLETVVPEDREQLFGDIEGRQIGVVAGRKFFQTYRVQRPDGGIRWIEDESFAIFDAHGHHIGFAGIASDISTNKLIEKNLYTAKKNAEEASQLKTHFINNMQHDIRTPLAGILGAAQILTKREDDPFKQDLLGALAKAAQELLEYCNDLVDFANVEYNSRPVSKKSFPFTRLLEASIDTHIPAAISKKLQLSLEYDDRIPTVIMGDSYRIKRILLNLLSNAIKFTETGYVKLKVRCEKRFAERDIIIRFSIEDSGIGIPQDKQEIIYEKFMRLDPSNRGVYKGSGLGLRVVKQFVDELQGDIYVDSQVGKGTTFTVDLPLALPLSDNVVDMEAV